jgi:hypothetical protein
MSEPQITISVVDEFAETIGIETPYNCVITYKEGDDEYGPIEKRGSPLSIEYPQPSVNIYQHLSQIEDQLAVYNEPRNNYQSHLRSNFDAGILEMLPTALDEEGLQLADFDIDARYFHALIIKKSRNITSNNGIVDYLQSNAALANTIGFESVPQDQSTFWYQFKKIDYNVLEPVVRRLVHAAHRNGFSLPDSIIESYHLGKCNLIDVTKLPQDSENQALKNWIDEILDDVIGPVTFGRAENKYYTEEEIIGATALAALINGPYSAPAFGSWIFDDPDIISGNHLYTLIESLEKQKMDEIFRKINNRIIEYASQIGFFQGSQHIALDTTWANWSGQGNNDDLQLINNPKRCESGRGWCFAALALMSNEARFVLGIDLVLNKSDTIDIFRGQLRDVYNAGVDIGRIHTDREFYAGDAIDMCRTFAVNDFAIRVKMSKNGKPPEKIKAMELSPGEAKIVKDVEFANVKPRVNVCGQEVPEDSKKETNRMGFLTDLTEDDVQASSLYHTFNNRWSVESFFKQLKYGLAPKTKSPDPMARLFFFKIGSVFHNLHVLVNRARSPKYGYRLDVPYYQVLMAIAYTVLSNE